MSSKHILLLTLPFGALERQALGLSILKSCLSDISIPSKIRYLTFPFAELIGVEEYYWIGTELPHTAFAGEWLFTEALYGPRPEKDRRYIRTVLKQIWQLNDEDVSRLRQARNMVGPFLDYCLQTIPWEKYAMVGFTSTFEQNLASLALAKKVKEIHPDLRIVFGGSNWEGEMGLELHRHFPFVDFVCVGEAEKSFPDLARLVLTDTVSTGALESIPGIIHRSDGKSVSTGLPELVTDLDEVPIPDYSDYFRDFECSSTGAFVVPTLLFESSRGCWWGQHSHCRFCGLNGDALKFRHKSSSNVFRELRFLADQWQTDMMQAVDNVVHMGFFKKLFPAFARYERPLSFFYEVRANLTRKQVRVLRDAGVESVQPGIESLNDHILDLMNKGTTALQNIQLLKWCKEYGVRADWNFLYGFPGETKEDYKEILDLLPSISFLDPPCACGPIRLDRFSPYFNRSEEFRLTNVRPIKPYQFLYPFGEASLRRIAYYFDFDYESGRLADHYASEVIEFVKYWQEHPEPGSLRAVKRLDGSLALLDTRSASRKRCTIFKGLDRELYEFCDQARDLGEVHRHLKDKFPKRRINKDQVRRFLEGLVAYRLMVTDGRRYLSLALGTRFLNNEGSKRNNAEGIPNKDELPAADREPSN